MEKTQLAVIGGGPAGMMAAIHAAAQGIHVTLFEHKERPGKKILSTGNGRCNLTNMSLNEDGYRGSLRNFACHLAEEFTPEQLRVFFRQNGLPTVDRNGYVYPITNQASSVRNLMEQLCYEAGVQIICHADVSELRQTKKGAYSFVVSETAEQENKGPKKTRDTEKKISRKISWLADSVILSCGGKASPVTGSDGSGFGLAESMGICLNEATPALCGLFGKDDIQKEWNGVRCQGRISIPEDRTGEKITESGELQLTSSGISGIPVFQISRFAIRKLRKNEPVHAELCFLPPDLKEEEWMSIVHSHAKRRSILVSSLLLPEKLAGALLKKCSINEHEPFSEKNAAVFFRLASNYIFFVSGSEGYEKAQVTAGGIPKTEVHTNSCESNRYPGLFFAGEILDVDGICGGYNLHFAFACGRRAGMESAAYLKGLNK